MIRGMARKKNRAGVLIFVSLAEHYVRIVADDGIASKVDQSVWQDAIDTLLSCAGEGEIAEGFIIAVEKCGRSLSRAFSARAWGRGPAAGQDLSDLTSMFRKSCSTFSMRTCTNAL